MRHALLKMLIIPLLLTANGVLAQMQGYSPKGADQRAVEVSLIQLIANPQAYDGKRVRLIGFLRLEFEGNAIYLHKEDYEHGISENGLWIDVPRDMTKDQQQRVNTQYAICEAMFRASGHGHMDVFSGELTNVSRLETWPRIRSESVAPTSAKPPGLESKSED
jgi:hypothetical protein